MRWGFEGGSDERSGREVRVSFYPEEERFRLGKGGSHGGLGPERGIYCGIK